MKDKREWYNQWFLWNGISSTNELCWSDSVINIFSLKLILNNQIIE
jgi:hypothetical protein